MKKIVRILAGLVMGLMCVNCASARSGNEEKVSETRSVNPFHSIEVESVASVYFTQSDTYSLRVEGEKKWVDQTKCTVKDGVLLIAWAEKGKKTTRNVNGLSIYISAPDLQKVAFEGVGSFNCKSRLNLKDVKFDVEGVGSLHVADLHAGMYKSVWKVWEAVNWP